jgi:NADPH-dependent 2,4-dienoyl-CoA reductase/sulfur reductase-like enzyme
MVLAFLTSGAALAFSLSSGMRPTRSSATRVAMQQDAHSRRPHVAVIGGGWGGWGAAKALIENGVQVTLLDTLADPTGSTPYVSPS